LGNDETVHAEPVKDPFEWDYAPPPTPYDLVRDSPVTRGGRYMLHAALHPFIRRYNKLTVINRETLIDNWPCIITPNHSSHMDTMAIFAALPLRYVNRMFAAAAKDYFFRNGMVSFWSRLIANVIPLDRIGTEKAGLQISLTKLKDKRSIIIFPEGTRTVTGEIGSFKAGAIMLSRRAKVPIIPVYIRGTLQSMPKSTKFPRPAKIEVVFGEPLRYWEAPLDVLENADAALDLEQRVKRLKLQREEVKRR
jgi:1-acyl-sn-glycerol-3-phosphate acyltransferase